MTKMFSAFIWSEVIGIVAMLSFVVQMKKIPRVIIVICNETNDESAGNHIRVRNGSSLNKLQYVSFMRSIIWLCDWMRIAEELTNSIVSIQCFILN